jgi:hypothetical protein
MWVRLPAGGSQCFALLRSKGQGNGGPLVVTANEDEEFIARNQVYYTMRDHGMESIGPDDMDSADRFMDFIDNYGFLPDDVTRAKAEAVERIVRVQSRTPSERERA